MFFVIYKDSSLQWRWTLYADNNRKIAASGEGYLDKFDCLAAIEVVKRAGTAPICESQS